MPLSTRDPFDDNCAHLATFPDHILRDLARNDCAGHEYRKHAVEVLLVRKSPLVKHPDLLQFVQELEVELDGIEFEHPDPGYSQGTPLSASVTTNTMFADNVTIVDLEAMRKEGFLVDTVVSEEEPIIVPTLAPIPIPPKPSRIPRKKKDTPDAT